MAASVDGQSSEAVAVITGSRYATGPHTAVRGSLHVVGERLHRIDSEAAALPSSASVIDAKGFLLLPGLVNAHDHLQYALHPRLGNPPYGNYVEWGEDIHATLPSVISHYKSVSKDVRLWWGGIRNLLCGVTTVCHHDPPWPALKAEGYPIKVLRRYGWAHSVGLAPSIHESWGATPEDYPFFIHACEGTDEFARRELAELDRLGMLDSRTVIVHGLALEESGAVLLEQRQASLILCLSSNQFLYGALPQMKLLGTAKKIALGNDSPLTAKGDLLDEVRFAIEHASIPTDEAYRMITDLPAGILRLTNGEGHICESGCADLVAVRDSGEPPHQRLLALSWRDVEFVMVAGEVRLASEDIWRRLPPTAKQDMEPLQIDGFIRWLRAPVRQLVQQAEAVLGAGMVRMGERVVQLGGAVIPIAPALASALARVEERP